MDMDFFMSNITPKVTDDMNSYFTSSFSEEEVSKALFQMHPDKAPGPDGFLTLFFQHFWREVKDEVVKEVLGFLNNDILDNRLNETNIILVPKKKEPTKVEDFRPINLCNVSMKIITKTLANRLSSCLPSIVSEYQSAFVRNRLITDNINLVHEVCHLIRRKTKGRKGLL